jgi:ATP-dependent exoDNAse (exonuclease V) beta subunit
VFDSSGSQVSFRKAFFRSMNELPTPRTRSELDIYETERRLLYVACARAREHLLLTDVTPTSEYLANFTS